ncbi:Ribose transport system permease protein rbsC, partial [Dysosmobacter welbionis]
QLRDPLEELGGHHAVDHAVVGSQAQVHHGPDHDLAVAHHRGIHHVAHAQNRQLRLVDDGREAGDAIGPEAGDGEGAAGHVLHAQLAGAGGLDQSLRLLGDLCQGLLLAVLHIGHDQAIALGDRQAHVHVLVAGQHIVREAGVHVGELGQGLGNHLHQDVVVGQLDPLLLQAVLQLGPQVLHSRDLHRTGVGDPRRGVPGVGHVGSDAAAQRIHLHRLLVVALNSGSGLSGGSCGCTHTGGGQHVRLHHAALDVQLADVHAQLGSQLGSHGAGLGTGHKVLHVLGHHGPVGAGAGDLGEVIALFLRQLLGVGSRQHVGTGGTVRMGRGGGGRSRGRGC